MLEERIKYIQPLYLALSEDSDIGYKAGYVEISIVCVLYIYYTWVQASK